MSECKRNCYDENTNDEKAIHKNMKLPIFLRNDGYPRNIIKLKHALERAVLLSKNGLIDVKNLPEEFQTVVKTDIAQMPQGSTLHDSIMLLEKQKIVNALIETGGKKIEASKKLGISRKVLWKKIKEYNLDKLPAGDIK